MYFSGCVAFLTHPGQPVLIPAQHDLGIEQALLLESDQRLPLFECGTGRCAKQPRDSLGRDLAFRFVDDSPLEEAVRSEPVSEMGFPK